MKKILIIYATAGIGHKKAAIAVKKALDETAPPDTEAILIDALDYTPRFFKWTYLQLYLLAVNKLTVLWGFMYYLTDNRHVNKVVSHLRRLNNWLNSKVFVKYLTDLKPDVIVTTHFFPSEVISDLKARGVINSRLITIITDYRLHSWWVADHIDTYIVSNEDAEDDLIRWGVPRSRIQIMGIPVEPVFVKKLDREKLKTDFGLEKGLFTVLAIGGGFGVGPIEKIVRTLNEVLRPLQVIVICGHNDELIRRLEALRPSLKVKMKFLGFVDNVYEFMEVADILISKSGGITVTESFAKELPMIVISPIPGQETRNCEFIVRRGAARKMEGFNELRNVVEDLIAHPEKMEEMRSVIRKIKAPRACYDIAQMAVDAARG